MIQALPSEQPASPFSNLITDTGINAVQMARLTREFAQFVHELYRASPCYGDRPYMRTDLTSPAADAFRLLLRLYPEAAGIESGREADDLETPYQVALQYNLPTYYRRLLLRAAPHLDPAELHRLNWEERRLAMYVASAVAARTPTSLFASKDLLRHVVSFL